MSDKVEAETPTLNDAKSSSISIPEKHKEGEREATKLRHMVAERIECPRCKKIEFNYVRYKDGRLMIVSPCGWELLEVATQKDDLEAAMEDDGYYE